MARVSGRCPVCGESIHVNDEKQVGHCVKCGSEINVLESIRLFQREAPPAASQQQGGSQRQQRREERAKEAARQGKATESSQIIRDMFQLCTSEQDYLMLRPRIMKMNIPDSEKALLLETLDNATKQRLKEVLKKAEDYKKSQESPASLFLGCVVIAGIGLAINLFFSAIWPGVVAIVLAVFGVIGGISDRTDKKKIAESKCAAELVEQYRKLGYKI